MGLKCTFWRSFSINIQSAVYISLFRTCGFNQRWMQNSVFNHWLGIYRCGEPIMHCSIPYYVRDLSIQGFWYLWRSWKESPAGIKGLQLSFGRVQSYTQIFNCMRVQPSTVSAWMIPKFQKMNKEINILFNEKEKKSEETWCSLFHLFSSHHFYSPG